MNDATAQHLARNWIAAWNRHDLGAVLDHYAEEIEFTSPLVAKLAGETSGTLRGKAALGSYFAKGLAAYPGLHFELQQVLAGIDSATLVYRSVNDLIAAEVVQVGDAGKIRRAQVHYGAALAKETRTAPVPNEWHREGYTLTDDPAKADVDAICRLLQTTYWAEDRPREVIEKSLRHSTSLHLMQGDRQVGLIRGVTDHATFTWVCDVIIDPAHRGHGLGKWLVECFLAHPELQTISHHLCTKDAHGLYESFGFQRIEAMRRSLRAMPFLLKEPPVPR